MVKLGPMKTPPHVTAHRGPFMGALSAARDAAGYKGPTFAQRVNAAVDADPSLGSGRWTRMIVHNQERLRREVTETTVRRYAAGIGDVEPILVFVPKGATRVTVDILDQPEAP